MMSIVSFGFEHDVLKLIRYTYIGWLLVLMDCDSLDVGSERCGDEEEPADFLRRLR